MPPAAPNLRALRIRRMRPEDLPYVVAIERRLHPRYGWTWESFAYEIHRALGWAWVAEVRHFIPLVAGYLVLWEEGAFLHIANISVHPAYQGRGIGSRLMRVAYGLARRLGKQGLSLEVRVGNLRAIRWYQRLGFRIRRRIRGLYFTPRGPEDGLLMEYLFPMEARNG